MFHRIIINNNKKYIFAQIQNVSRNLRIFFNFKAILLLSPLFIDIYFINYLGKM
jgi:hypothetical protein